MNARAPGKQATDAAEGATNKCNHFMKDFAELPSYSTTNHHEYKFFDKSISPCWSFHIKAHKSVIN